MYRKVRTGVDDRSRTDAKDLMAPPIEPDKLRALMKNPWSSEMLQKEVELLKLAKKQKEEEGWVTLGKAADVKSLREGGQRASNVASAVAVLGGHAPWSR
jgi:DNA-binding NtrC family response regulator